MEVSTKRAAKYQQREESGDKNSERFVKSNSKDKSEPDLDYVDTAYNKIEGNSWFYWFIAFPVGFVYCYGYSRLIPFLILMPKLSCSLNGGSDWIGCTEVEACVGSQVLYQIDRQSEDTIINWVTELDLVCTSKLNLSLLGSLYFVGYVVGALTFVRLGDIVGRKPVLMFGSVCFWIFSIAIYFNTNLYVMYLLSLLIGTFEIVRFSLGYILMVELLPKDRRNKYYGIITVIESLMSFIIVGCCWRLKNTYPIIMLLTVLSFFQIVFSYFAPESPKLLYSIGKFKQMEESLSYIAKINGTTYTKESKNLNTKSEDIVNKGQVVSFFEALKVDSIYRRNLFIMAFNWCVCSLSCYMTLYYVGMYPGNLFVNAIILFIADTISTYLANSFVGFFGFTSGFNFTFMFVFSTSIMFELFNIYPHITYPCVLIIRLGIILCFAMCYLSQSEYFKPNLSTRSFAFCNVLARVLTILSPVIVNTVPHPILIITALTLIASISSKYLVKQ